MKTLFFTNLYPFAQQPTRGMFNVQVFRAIARHCEARVVTPLPWWTRWRRPGEWLVAPHETTTGIEARFPTYWTVPRYALAWNARAMYRSMRPHVRRLHREFPFEAILAAWAYPDAVAAAYLARDYHCPLVINVLGSDLNALGQDDRCKPQIRWAMEQAQRVIVVSHALKERVIELGVSADKVLVQHNGVDGEKFRLQDRTEVRARLGLPGETRRVCYVGNFVPEKGVDVLVEAMAVLLQRGETGVHLSLIGSGSLEPTLRAFVQTNGLAEQVQFHGRKPHSEIPDWMSATDVFCLPSRREGCPNVVLEALSAGRPVVASAVGGVPELLDARQGALVPAGDAERLASALTETLARDWSPEALRATVAGRSWNDVGDAYYAALATP